MMNSEVSWVIESCMFTASDSENISKMKAHLERKEIPFFIIEVVPFSYEITGDVPTIPDACVAYGTTCLRKVARKHNWNPGVWDAGFEEKKLNLHLGQHALNYDAAMMKLNSVERYIERIGLGEEHEIFIKPNSDNKDFAGLLINAAKFKQWNDRIIESGYLEDANIDVVVSTPKELKQEWRCVVVDGKFVAGSSYKRSKVPHMEQGVEDGVVEFVEHMAAIYSPAPVFVCDIARTEGYELKVVEYNSFNSAGLYACDVEAVIDQVTDYVRKAYGRSSRRGI